MTPTLSPPAAPLAWSRPLSWRSRPSVPRALSPTQRHTRQLAALAALCSAALPALAQAPLAGLGPSFRPQALSAPAGAGPTSTAPTGANPAAAATEAAAVPMVRVLVTSAERAVATVEGRLVRVGDLVQGRRVLRIDRQGVVLAAAESGPPQRLDVSLAASAKKKSPATAEPMNERNPR